MVAGNQQNLETGLLHPFDGGRILLPPDILDQCTATRMHDALQSCLSLIADCEVFADVKESAGFDQGFGGFHGSRDGRCGDWAGGR